MTLNEAVAQLDAHGCESRRTIWTFDSAVLWMARGPEGVWVGVFAPRELPEGVQSALKARLDDFLSAAEQAFGKLRMKEPCPT